MGDAKEFLVNIVANNSKPKLPIQVIFAILLAVAVISTIVIVFASRVMPMILESTPTAIQPLIATLTIFPSPSFTETSIAPTDNPTPTRSPTITATNTPTSTFTPTYTSTVQLLPDLTVTNISDPVCLPDRNGSIIEFNVYIWNIGQGSTRPFGSFDVDVFLILGQRHYGLDEWAEDFDGVIGVTNTEITRLNPNADTQLTVVLDLKGNKTFGIKAIANSGANFIPETDTTNNILIKYFSIYCY